MNFEKFLRTPFLQNTSRNYFCLYIVCQSFTYLQKSGYKTIYYTLGLRQGDILSIIFFFLLINDLPSVLINDLPSVLDTKTNNENPMLNTTNVNSLVFADDFAIFSQSQKKQQQKIDTLDKYCRNWSLEGNIKKN